MAPLLANGDEQLAQDIVSAEEKWVELRHREYEVLDALKTGQQGALALLRAGADGRAEPGHLTRPMWSWPTPPRSNPARGSGAIAGVCR